MLIKMQMHKHATWGLLVQLQWWFPSMHTHHAWVLLEKILSSNFWVIGKPGLLHVAGLGHPLGTSYTCAHPLGAKQIQSTHL